MCFLAFGCTQSLVITPSLPHVHNIEHYRGFRFMHSCLTFEYITSRSNIQKVRQIIDLWSSIYR